MTAKHYNVVFEGQIAEGRTIEDVKRNLSVLYKVDHEKIERLFVGHPVLIRKNVDYQTAMNYKAVFEKAGALCRIEGLEYDAQKHSPRVIPTKKQVSKAAEPKMMTCPHCGFEQPPSSECIRCGIVIEKYMDRTGTHYIPTTGPSKQQTTQKIDLRSFGEQLPGVFLYPFSGKGIYVLIGGVLFFGILGFIASFSIFGIFINIFLGGYLCAYMMRIVRSSARGNKEPPDWPTFSDLWEDILRPAFLVNGTVIFCFVPVLIYITSGLFEFSWNDFILWVLIGWGLFYMPMGLLAVSMFEKFASLNPLFIIPSIAKVFADYSIACLVLLLMFVLRFFGNKIFSLSIPFFGTFIDWFLVFYFTMVEMRILGLVYHTNRRELAWFEQ